MNDVPPDLSQLCTSPSKVCQKLEAILEPYQRRDSIDQQLPKLRSHIYIDSFGSSHPHSLQVAPVTLSLPPSLPPSLSLSSEVPGSAAPLVYCSGQFGSDGSPNEDAHSATCHSAIKQNDSKDPFLGRLCKCTCENSFQKQTNSL